MCLTFVNSNNIAGKSSKKPPVYLVTLVSVAWLWLISYQNKMNDINRLKMSVKQFILSSCIPKWISSLEVEGQRPKWNARQSGGWVKPSQTSSAAQRCWAQTLLTTEIKAVSNGHLVDMGFICTAFFFPLCFSPPF